MVFRGLDFVAEAGTALVVVGPNGIGKSSLLRQIAGLIAIEDGSLTLDGGDADAPVGDHCHYFGHQDALKPSLTVRENLDFWRRFYGAGGRAVDEALDIVAIDHIGHLPAGYLSAGQRRRLSLARLLVSDRPVWLLDEPSSALDAASEDRLVALMTDHLDGGGLIVAATHAPLAIPAMTQLDMTGVAR